ncbi:hypothetical protein, partial [Streptomyces sp. NPDC001833]|uniref:hypothetical protein n=1 Tax=Streptomyces sp. NPDC001833 TaxID=3154658 RepID=UPI00332AC0AE
MSPVTGGAAPGPVAVGRSVRAGPGRRGGTVHARQDARADLRLVPPALAVWATAALALDAPVGWTAATAVVCLVAGVILLLPGALIALVTVHLILVFHLKHTHWRGPG